MPELCRADAGFDRACAGEYSLALLLLLLTSTAELGWNFSYAALFFSVLLPTLLDECFVVDVPVLWLMRACG